jgi:hypothetical protein
MLRTLLIVSPRGTLSCLQSSSKASGKDPIGEIDRRNQHGEGQRAVYVNDVDTAIIFYTEKLGFKLDMRPAPGFARLSKGNLQLLLNRPGAGGAGQSTNEGRVPSPCGWNRFQIESKILPVWLGS